MKKWSVLLLFLIINCTSLALRKTDSDSLIACRMKFPGFMVKGYGCIIQIKNVSTGTIYKSKSLSPLFGEMAYIENVPQGNYRIIKMVIPTGQFKYTFTLPDTQTICPNINITKPCICFLGSYIGKLIVPAFKRNEMYIDKIIDDSKDNINKDLLKTNWNQLDIDTSQFLFNDNHTKMF